MSPALLEWLRCPETGQRLTLADEALRARLEAAREAGALRFVSTPPGASQFEPQTPISHALLREDGQIVYLVQNGVPLLLPGHGVEAVPPDRA